MPNLKEQIEIRRHRISYAETYEVWGDELRRLQFEEPQRSHELSFSLSALSVALTLLIPLIVGQPPKMSDRRFAVFVAIIIVGFVFSLFFGLRWFSKFKQRNQLFEQIRARQIGPVGEAGAEITAEQLAELPSEAATGVEDASGSADASGAEPRE